MSSKLEKELVAWRMAFNRLRRITDEMEPSLWHEGETNEAHAISRKLRALDGFAEGLLAAQGKPLPKWDEEPADFAEEMLMAGGSPSREDEREIPESLTTSELGYVIPFQEEIPKIEVYWTSEGQIAIHQEADSEGLIAPKNIRLDEGRAVALRDALSALLRQGKDA